ncbi:MAG: hypothetical protein IID35_12110 [Planctomycetes bacterium]|nr:hypothetical protein [Planctomycetota bacterium]
MVAISMITLVGMASLTIDVATMYRARAEAQAAADSAAMAAAWRLMDNDALSGTPDMFDEINNARTTAAQIAAMNEIINEGPVLQLNAGNDVSGDIVIGYLSNPNDPNEVLNFDDPNTFNTVKVMVHRDDTGNGPIELFFAGIFGVATANVTASAFASFRNDVGGFQVYEGGPNAGLLPFTLHRDAWNGLMDGTWSTGDNFSYDPDTDTVSAGPDGIPEINVFPGSGTMQLPSGNFGTVDFGNSNNSTADLSRQILEGLNSDDLSYFDGTLALGEDGTLVVNGDTGLSAGIKDELAAIIGMPRTIALFEDVTGNGNNAIYTITGFVGIRIMSVQLTGPPADKGLIMQPAFVIDGTAIANTNSAGTGSFVYRPVELIR